MTLDLIIPLTFSRVQPGQLFLGRISDVRDFELVVSLPNRLFGIVPCNLVSEQLSALFTEYAQDNKSNLGEVPSLKTYYPIPGDWVIVKVVSIADGVDGQRRRIDLSMLPSQINSGISKDELANGLLLQGIVQSWEDRGCIVDLGFATGFCNLNKCDASEALIVGKPALFTLLLEGKPQPVLQLSAKANRLKEIFFRSSSTVMAARSLLPGNLVEGVVQAAQETHYVISLPGNATGVMELLSMDNTDKKLREGEKVRVRIVWVGVDGTEPQFLLSARVTDFSSSHTQSLSTGTIITATCKAIDPTRGVMFSCQQSNDCFGHITKLFDGSELPKRIPNGTFTIGQEYQVRITGYDCFDSLHLVSTQPSILDAPFISYDGLEPGAIVKGTIVRLAPEFGLLVQLADRIRAICPLFHLSDSHVASTRYLTKYREGQRYRFRVLQVDSTSRKVMLCRRKQLLDSSNPPLCSLSHAQPGSTHDGYVISVKEGGAVIRFYSDLCGFLPIAEMSDVSFVQSALDVVVVGQSVAVKVKSVDLQKKQLIVSLRTHPLRRLKKSQTLELTAGEPVHADPSLVALPPSEPMMDKPVVAKRRLKDIFEQLPDEASSPLAEEEGPSDGKAQASSMREKKMMRIRTQRDITDDFERRLLATPNASAVWIEYAAALLSATGDASMARTLLERALRSISIREQDEKLNIWTALLNIENIYGTDGQLRVVFQRALTVTDQKKLYLRLAQIFEASGKLAEACELHADMQRRFSGSCKVWLAGLQMHMARDGDLPAARQLLPAALSALPARKHAKFIMKAAQAEYRHGDVERARTLFEKLLASHPKRLDLWMVYLQMEQNRVSMDGAEPDHVRRLFERALSLKLSSKKAKGLFKTFLAFERAHGNVMGVERVKQLARQYVEGMSG